MLEYLLDGGILMPVLLGLSIVGLAVVIDRWQVFKIANIDTSVMRRMILQLLLKHGTQLWGQDQKKLALMNL